MRKRKDYLLGKPGVTEENVSTMYNIPKAGYNKTSVYLLWQ